MGVRVSETMAETRMVTASVMANSGRGGLTMSPMKSKRYEHGNEGDRERDNGEPDLFGALERGLGSGDSPSSMYRGNVLDHDDCVIDHEAGGDGKRHQRQIIEAIAEGRYITPNVPTSDNGTAMLGMTVAATFLEKEEDDHDNQTNGEHQLKLHILNRGPDGVCPVGENGDCDGAGQRCPKLRQDGPDAVNHGDDIGPGLPLNVHNDRGRSVHPRGLLDIFRALDDGGDIGEPNRSSVFISNNQRAVIDARADLIVGSNRERLARAIEVSFGLIYIRQTDGGSQAFKTEAVGGKRGGIDLNPDCRFLASA